METTFHNVTITIAGCSAKKAYEELCALLAASQYATEWETDTYSTSRGRCQASEPKPTRTLWPKG